MMRFAQLVRGVGAVAAGATGAVAYQLSKEERVLRFPKNQISEGLAKLRLEEQSVDLTMKHEELQQALKRMDALIRWHTLPPLSPDYPAVPQECASSVPGGKIDEETKKTSPAIFTVADYAAANRVELSDLEMSPQEVKDIIRDWRMKQNGFRSAAEYGSQVNGDCARTSAFKMFNWISRRVRF
ncbi:hypothetical protein GHT06_020576 [Daphnia sinensis]|uniref:Uncharacterized protein n=1 Tax=Daphnia sinensis TaxID=1820382 RepID=A0AAD5KJ88_9CRUS|nr:hypothetical protein GHT06_020576 [Daphnia sinensis]